MKPPIAARVLLPLLFIEQGAPLLVAVAGERLIFLAAHGEVVIVDEVVPRVAGRVDVDHLHLPEVGLQQQLEGVEVVALDVEVLGGVEVDGFRPSGAQGLADGRVGEGEGLALAGPVEPVALARPVDDIGRQFLLQKVEINRPPDRAIGPLGLGDAVRKKGGDALDIRGGEVGGGEVEAVH